MMVTPNNVVHCPELRSNRNPMPHINSCQHCFLTKLDEYSVWRGMKSRCYNINETFYYNYGGRGITVCDRWKYSFENFIVDMGLRPNPDYTLDRKDSNGNYEPDNCRWATRKEQARNIRTNLLIPLGDKMLTASEISEKTGLSEAAIRYRYKQGWEKNNLVSPLHENTKYEINGGSYTIPEICKMNNIPETTLRLRLRTGMTLQEAISKPRPIRKTGLIKYKGEMISAAEFSRRTGLSISLVSYRRRKGWTDEELLRPADGNDSGVFRPKRDQKLTPSQISILNMKKKANSMGEALPCDQLLIDNPLKPGFKMLVNPPGWKGYDI